MADSILDTALCDMASHLQRLGRPHALVGGWAVSLRVEARFTRDIDFAIVATSDADVERLVQDLRLSGDAPVAVVEHLDKLSVSPARARGPSLLSAGGSPNPSQARGAGASPVCWSCTSPAAPVAQAALAEEPRREGGALRPRESSRLDPVLETRRHFV